jgi:hypothetical protein
VGAGTTGEFNLNGSLARAGRVVRLIEIENVPAPNPSHHFLESFTIYRRERIASGSQRYISYAS